MAQPRSRRPARPQRRSIEEMIAELEAMAGPEPELAPPRLPEVTAPEPAPSIWQRVKGFAHKPLFGENLGVRTMEALESVFPAGPRVPFLDQPLGTALAALGGGIAEQFSTPSGLALAALPVGRAGKLASRAASGLAAAEGGEMALGADRTPVERGLGAVQAVLGGLGTRGGGGRAAATPKPSPPPYRLSPTTTGTGIPAPVKLALPEPLPAPGQAIGAAPGPTPTPDVESLLAPLRPRLSAADVAENLRTAGRALPDEQALRVAEREVERAGPGFGARADELIGGRPETDVAATLHRDLANLDSGYQRLLADERGSIDPALLARMLAIPAGGGLGAALDPDDPMRGALIGAAGGGALAFAPQQLERLRYASMLAGPAIAKSAIGGVGSTLMTAAEKGLTGETDLAKRLLGEVFSRRTVREGVEAFKRGPAVVRDLPPEVVAKEAGLLGIPGRAIGAPDYAIREAMKRAGIEESEAAKRMFLGTPETTAGKTFLQFQQSSPLVRLFLPFARTATTMGEQSVLPFKRLLDQTLSPAARKVALAQAGLGVGAGAAGALYGGSEFAQKPEGMAAAPFIAPLAGPYAPLFAVGAGLGRGLAEDEAGPEVASRMSNEALRQVPFFPSPWGRSIERIPESFAPRILGDVAESLDPMERDTSGSTFARLLARIPFLRESLPAK